MRLVDQRWCPFWWHVYDECRYSGMNQRKSWVNVFKYLKERP